MALITVIVISTSVVIAIYGNGDVFILIILFKDIGFLLNNIRFNGTLTSYAKAISTTNPSLDLILKTLSSSNNKY